MLEHTNSLDGAHLMLYNACGVHACITHVHVELTKPGNIFVEDNIWAASSDFVSSRS